MGVKVLLPDDAVVRDILENSFLQRAGFEFVKADAAGDVFQQVNDLNPALAVFDLEMPGVDVPALCSRIKEDANLGKVQLILIIPNESRKRDDEISSIDVDAIVSRPIEHQRFLTSASHLLGVFDRTKPRFETFIMVSCGSDIDELHQGWIRNINSGGAFIETKDLLPIDYRLQIQFELGDGSDLISCTARVAWVNHPDWIKCENLPPGMGVQFLDLGEEDQELVSAFVDSQLTQS
ncbi:MAG: hypothetical protein C0623_10190 [Desulfuromonas sp.]|nr:MAG: hypothetical protein C0623_10190 [Desulfuromonas sp.]